MVPLSWGKNSSISTSDAAKSVCSTTATCCTDRRPSTFNSAHCIAMSVKNGNAAASPVAMT